MEQIQLHFEPERKLYSVAELNAKIRGFLESEFDDVHVAGEISGVRLASSGHYYFSLKDGEAQLKCVCFRMTARRLRFKPQDGISVLARGRIDVYEARGEYQLLVESLQPQGHGALQFAFEQLKRKLMGEGLFDPERKKPLPKLPQRIGIVTSPSGAVIQDMLQILSRRFPGLHIRLYPAVVQGEGSVEAVCRGIRYFAESSWADVVIVARGGGSLEDLWTFNEEGVARTIAACGVPVISAVGHETDFTIADFVADLRAPTPSAAAELVICTREQLLERVFACRRSAERAILYRLSVTARRLHEQGIHRATATLHRFIGRQFQRLDELDRCSGDYIRKVLRRLRDNRNHADARLRKMDLRLRFAAARLRLEAADHSLDRLGASRLNRERSRLESLVLQLGQLSPVNVLERGYAIVQSDDGTIVKDAAQAPEGTPVRIRLSQGRLRARVTESDPGLRPG
ncbi:MAG: exodeoxyribonuclease VII large subunit [Bryobacteraceae bacterium]